MDVLLEQLNENAQIPTQARPGDFCYDVVAVSEEEIAPNVWRYGLGFAYTIYREDPYIGYAIVKKHYYPVFAEVEDTEHEDSYRVAIDFRARSSIWKTGMILSNCVGTLDEFYRGEVMAVFYHVMPNMPRYKVGDKIGQIKLAISLPMNFMWGAVDRATERGEGGFGSTGR